MKGPLNSVLDTLIVIRKRRKITQAEMARRLGCSVKTYRLKERGSIRLSELVELCVILGVKIIFVEGDSVIG